MGVKKELSVEERAKIVALFTDSFPKKSMRTIAVLTGHALSTILKLSSVSINGRPTKAYREVGDQGFLTSLTGII
jgi:hypothetical protein